MLYIGQKALIPLLVVLATTVMGFVFYVHGQAKMEEQLRERLRSTAAVAALAIDPYLVESITGPDAVNSPQYQDLVSKLDRIRDSGQNIRFAYIMRRTGDPLKLEFVADADAALTMEELDRNNDSEIGQDEVVAYPGDIYDITAIPVLQNEAFVQPTVGKDVTVEEWGRFISGYAPIATGDGRVVGVVGIDMDAEEFYDLSRSIFSPVALLLVVLSGVVWAIYMQVVFNRRRMEAMEQLDAERTAFLDLATHQLGMPLATFRWWIELLKENKDKALESDDAIAQLEEGVERMDKVLKALTDVTKIREERLMYKPVRVSIRPVIERAAAEVEKQLKNRSQKIRLMTETDLPPILLDEKLFQGILHELIQNASFYSPDGSEIAVHARREGRMVAVEVVDHGHGIPEKDLPYIFEKFRRGSNATRFRPVGNGLGLYIAKQVMEKAKGRITIASKIEQGTTVSLIFPSAE